jgi:hypothetical protein
MSWPSHQQLDFLLYGKDGEAVQFFLHVAAISLSVMVTSCVFVNYLPVSTLPGLTAGAQETFSRTVDTTSMPHTSRQVMFPRESLRIAAALRQLAFL